MSIMFMNRGDPRELAREAPRLAVAARLFALDEKRDRARSLTRYYRLGSRHGSNKDDWRGPEPAWRDEAGRVVNPRNRGLRALRRPPG